MYLSPAATNLKTLPIHSGRSNYGGDNTATTFYVLNKLQHGPSGPTDNSMIHYDSRLEQALRIAAKRLGLPDNLITVSRERLGKFNEAKVTGLPAGAAPRVFADAVKLMGESITTATAHIRKIFSSASNPTTTYSPPPGMLRRDCPLRTP